MRSEFNARRERLIEAVALTDDSLLERYLEFLTLSDDDFRMGLRMAMRECRLMPVFLMVAEQCVGVQPLLDFIEWTFPTTAQPPVPQEGVYDGRYATHLATHVDSAGNLYHVLRLWTHAERRGDKWVNGRTAEAFKVRKYFHLRGPRRSSAHTLVPGAIVGVWDSFKGRPGDTIVSSGALWVNPVHPRPAMMTFALESKVAAEILDAALVELSQFDHGLHFGFEDFTHRRTVSGHSKAQLDRAVNWLSRRTGQLVLGQLPEVQYRETIKLEVSGIEGIHERMENGLVEEFGACTLSVGPGDFANPLHFEENVDEDDIPRKFLGAVESGIRDGMTRGPSGGFPVMGLRVTCVGGDYDFMQSTDEHFRSAAKRGLRLALPREVRAY